MKIQPKFKSQELIILKYPLNYHIKTRYGKILRWRIYKNLNLDTQLYEYHFLYDIRILTDGSRFLVKTAYRVPDKYICKLDYNSFKKNELVIVSNNITGPWQLKRFYSYDTTENNNIYLVGGEKKQQTFKFCLKYLGNKHLLKE